MNATEAAKKVRATIGNNEIISCVDIGRSFAFSINTKNADDITPGLPIILVDKVSGEMSQMQIPPLENIDIIQQGKEIHIT